MAQASTKRSRAITITQRMFKNKEVKPGQIVAAIEKQLKMSTSGARTYFYYAKDQIKRARRSKKGKASRSAARSPTKAAA